MSDIEKDKTADKAAKSEAKQAAVKKLAIELKPKYPQCNDEELLKIAAVEQKKAAAYAKIKRLDDVAQRVLNPRVNSKAETRAKVIIGAMQLNIATTDATAHRYVKHFISQLKEQDQKLFADFLQQPPPAPSKFPELFAAGLIRETLTEAESSTSPRFTLTFNRNPALIAAMRQLIGA